MIKAVIFDVGGVMLRTEDPNPRREQEARLGLSTLESEELVFNSEMGTKAQIGEIGRVALWTWIGDHLNLDEEGLDAFYEGFWGGDVMDFQLIDYIRTLRPEYQTAIISNADDGLRAILANDYQIVDAFDLIVISAEEGIMKPDQEIYRRTLQRLGCRPEESVFIDDNLENVQAARALGMEAIHYRPGLDIPTKLQEILT